MSLVSDQRTATTSPLGLDLDPVTTTIGAEVRGLDLAGPLDDTTITAFHRALAQWKVLFVRDQSLDAAAQIAFASRLGPLTAAHPTMPPIADGGPAGEGQVYELDAAEGGRADHWHTDVTFTVRPPAISVLRTVQLPPVGGDTQWADTEAAYRRLPGPLRRLAEELRVVHTNAYDYGRVLRAGDDEAALRHRERFESTVFQTEHPVVRHFPDSGRRSLVLGGFAQQIVGLPSKVSTDLLAIFQSYVTRPEHIVRWRWRPGDVAIWDNRFTQHYAVNDYGDAARKVQRVTVAGNGA